MENIKKDSNFELPPWMEWTKEDSKELIMLYLQDYYDTLDDYYLERAVHIAKEHAIDLQTLIYKAKFQQS